MKKVFLAFTVVGVFLLASCGGGGSDAAKFCACYEEAMSEDGPSESCNKDMEALEEAFKEDAERFAKFKEEATKSCPDAAAIIDRMN